VSALQQIIRRAVVAPCLAAGAFVATPPQAPARLQIASAAGASRTDVPSVSTIGELRRRDLRVPVDGAHVNAMRGQFGDTREGGARGHEAVDIPAPRNTPIHAVENGTIEKLFLSRPGGITIYQFDPERRFAYYYAHLERYAAGLQEHQAIRKGDVIGYVGTTGNAPNDAPHLHFAIFELTPEKQWWKGSPVDPWLAFTR